MWQECKDLQNEIVNTRRDLHQYPELGVSLPKTTAYVTHRLEDLQIPYKVISDNMGIIATIEGAKPGKTVALRADMDALPVQEMTRMSYSSKIDGVMHACGHDAHTAMLLGAAKVLSRHKDKLKGTVRLLFQTAEEVANGATIIIREGGMENVDAVFGTHIGNIMGPEIPTGTIVAAPGRVMAAADRFVIKVKGTSCHGSTPEKGIDPIFIASNIVLALQSITTRELSATNPVVITIGKIVGGSQYNIIPDEVIMEGTLRSFEEEIRQGTAKRIQEMSEAVAKTFGGEVEFTMDWGAPSIINEERMAGLAAKAAIEVLGKEHVITKIDSPTMIGEDYSYYLEKAPGAFLLLSSSNPDKCTNISHHNPMFNIDEDVLWMGAAVFVKIVEDFLES